MDNYTGFQNRYNDQQNVLWEELWWVEEKYTWKEKQWLGLSNYQEKFQWMGHGGHGKIRNE